MLANFGKVFSSPVGKGFKFEWWSSFFLILWRKINSVFLMSSGSIMSENARQCGAHTENEQRCSPPPSPPACLLLSQCQHVCSFHLFTFFQPLLFSVPCPSQCTLILAEAGQSWDRRRGQTAQKPGHSALGSTEQVHHFSQRWVWMRNGTEIQDSTRVSAPLWQPRLQSRGALIPQWQTHLRKGIPETGPGNICAGGKELDPPRFSQSLRF